MNRQALLHIVERLEGILHKLPGAIQKPVLHELVPLKELFLQQRPPRLLLAGADSLPLPQIVSLIFHGEQDRRANDILFEVNRWQEIEVTGRGVIAFLDARGAGPGAEEIIRAELKRAPADAVLVISEKTGKKSATQNGANCVRWNDDTGSQAGVVAIHLDRTAARKSAKTDGEDLIALGRAWGTLEFAADPVSSEVNRASARELARLLAQRLPNSCRVEIVRGSGDRAAQREIAQVLVKSTAAICTAIGAQPIPLADLPILTTLQLVMVSGVMCMSGRERSLRAATEFMTALGVNVGAGMLLREGARAMLKFVPGWGNIMCGMIAGAGTYAIGQAASAYFLEGLTLPEARRRYLRGKKRSAPQLAGK